MRDAQAVVTAGSGDVRRPALLAPDEGEVAAARTRRGDRALERPCPCVGSDRRDERDCGALQPDAHDRRPQVELPLQLLQEGLVDRRGENGIRGEGRVPGRERERMADPHGRVGAEGNVLLVEREAVQTPRCPHATARLGHHLRPDSVARKTCDRIRGHGTITS